MIVPTVDRGERVVVFCSIAIEGESVPGQVLPEGPFGEWMGYYSDDTQERPFVNVKTILYRNDPILTCAPQHKPVDETGLLKGIAGAAQIWRALEASGCSGESRR